MEAKIGIGLLKVQTLFKGLSEDELEAVSKELIEKKYLPNETIIHEGELSTEVYTIVEGEVIVQQWNEEHSSESVIRTLMKGEVLGEMSFMDESVRSSTIKTIKPTTVLMLKKDVLPELILSKIYKNIAEINIYRLRHLNKLYVKNLQNYQKIYQYRQEIGIFLIYDYLILGIASLIALFFHPDIQSYMPWLIAVVPCALLIKAKGYEWSHFGLNNRKWMRVITATLLTFLIIEGLLFLFEWFINSSYSEDFLFGWRPEFKMNLAIPAPSLKWLLLGVYCFAQEFVSRGIMQTSLQDFLHDLTGYKSILLNSTFLFFLMIPLGFSSAFVIFLLGISMGFIYLKQKTLIGVILLRFLLMSFGLLNI